MGKKCIEKCNFYIKYFDKIKCFANPPYLDFSELNLKHTYIFFFGLTEKKNLVALSTEPCPGNLPANKNMDQYLTDYSSFCFSSISLF